MNYLVETNFLNVKEVSVFLNLSALTVYKYISEKKIKAIHWAGGNSPDKMNYRIKFKEEVVKYIDTLVKP